MNSTASDEGEFDFPVVSLPSNAKSFDSIVRYLIEELVRMGRFYSGHSGSITLEVLKRESLGSTAIGRAIAIPHAKSDLVDTVVGIVGKCRQPVNWPGSMDNKPVSIVCLLISPRSQHGDALKAFAVVARRFWQEPDKD